MSFKTELKNLGYYLITPVPEKYHFEGVNNRRSAIQLFVVTAVLPVAIVVAAGASGVIEEKIQDLKHWNTYRKTTPKN